MASITESQMKAMDFANAFFPPFVPWVLNHHVDSVVYEGYALWKGVYSMPYDMTPIECFYKISLGICCDMIDRKFGTQRKHDDGVSYIIEKWEFIGERTVTGVSLPTFEIELNVN